MKAKTIFGIISVSILIALAMTGCGSSSGGGDGILKLSMTDAPAADNFSAVNITISKVTVSQAVDENTDNWITLTETPQTFDILALNNATLQDLGIKSLPAGTYHQIRFYVTGAQVMVDNVAYDIKVPSGKFRTVGGFTLQDGITTELVVDFNVAKSIVKTGSDESEAGRYKYILKPTTRLIAKDITGAIAGRVLLNPIPAETTLITVSTTDSNGNQIAAVCDPNGSFTLGFLPDGSYDLTIEANGYVADTSQTGIAVTAGQTTHLPGDIALSQDTSANP